MSLDPNECAIWSCKIGEVRRGDLPPGSDYPMREAVERAYEQITGQKPDFIFSGWGAKLTEAERAVVDDTEPTEGHYQEWLDLNSVASTFADLLQSERLRRLAKAIQP